MIGILLTLASLMQPVAAEQTDKSGSLSLRRFELLDQLSGTHESAELNFYLRATADSLTFANAYLENGRKPKLFCTDAPLGVADLRGIVRDYIAFLRRIGQDTAEVKDKIGVVVIVIQKLRERHPCP